MLRRFILFSIAHFIATLFTGFISQGWDLDQLQYRSFASTGATYVLKILMWPHDEVVRILSGSYLGQHTWLIPSLIFANSALWGGAIAVVSIWQERMHKSRASSENGSSNVA